MTTEMETLAADLKEMFGEDGAKQLLDAAGVGERDPEENPTEPTPADITGLDPAFAQQLAGMKAATSAVHDANTAMLLDSIAAGQQIVNTQASQAVQELAKRPDFTK